VNEDQAKAMARESREREVVSRAISDGKTDRGTGGSNSYSPPILATQSISGISHTDGILAIVSLGFSRLFSPVDPEPTNSEIQERTRLKALYDVAYSEAKKPI
jgi:hypothetical protein